MLPVLGFGILATSFVLAATEYTISIGADTYTSGDPIEAQWTAPADIVSSDDWIGVFKVDADNRDYRDWAYVDSSDTSGTVTLTEDTPGTYEVRLLQDNGYTVVASSNAFTVTSTDDDNGDDPPETDYELTVSTTSTTVGTQVTIDWEIVGTESVSRDWIGLFEANESNRNYSEWFYVNEPTGSRTIILDETGTFEFRYLLDNGYEDVATSETITVMPPEDDDGGTEPPPDDGYAITVSTTTTTIGEAVHVTWEVDTSDVSRDWIGLFETNGSNRNYSEWFYVNEPTGSRTIILDETGTFEFRYLLDNGYEDVATSETITVTSSGDDNGTDPGDAIYSVSADQATYQVGSIANAVWEAPEGANTFLDWIGLYRPGTSDASYLDYEYTDVLSNKEQFPLYETGTFEFRYFKNNSYERVAVSDTFAVIDDPLICNGYDLRDVTNYPTGSGPVIALGNSLTIGVGASPGEDYVSELEQRLSIDITNAGVSGDTTEDALARLDSDVLQHDPSTVIVFIGGNDELRRFYEQLRETAIEEELEERLDAIAAELGYNWENVPLLTRAETFANLESIVTQIQNTGANVVVVGFDTSLFNDALHEGYETIASDTGSVFIPDIYDDIFGRPTRMSDLVHPNDVGYDIMADRIQLGLECLVE